MCCCCPFLLVFWCEVFAILWVRTFFEIQVICNAEEEGRGGGGKGGVREGGRHHFAFSRVHFRLPPFPKTLANRYEKRHLKGEGKREGAEKAIKRGEKK